MRSVAEDRDAVLSEAIIKKLHQLFYRKINADKAGEYRTEQIFITGTEYVPPESERVPGLMKKFVNDMNREKDRLHPIEWAALLHKGGWKRQDGKITYESCTDTFRLRDDCNFASTARRLHNCSEIVANGS